MRPKVSSARFARLSDKMFSGLVIKCLAASIATASIAIAFCGNNDLIEGVASLYCNSVLFGRFCLVGSFCCGFFNIQNIDQS